MGLWKSIKHAVKKVAKVALPIAATTGVGYLAGSALGLFGSSSSSSQPGLAPVGSALGTALNSSDSSDSSVDWSQLGLAGINSASSLYQASRSEAIAQQNLREQMAWNEYAAQHAHQWEMQDLKNAGLNPILTATGGNGATVHSVTPQMPDISGYGSALNNAFTVLSGFNNLKLQEANIGLINSGTLKNLQEANNLVISGRHTAKDIERLDEIIKQLKWDTSHYTNGNHVGRAAEDIKRYFGNSLAGNLLMWLLGVQQGTYPDVHKNVPKSGGD